MIKMNNLSFSYQWRGKQFALTMGGILPVLSTTETKQSVLLSQVLAKGFEKRISKKVWSLPIFCDR